MPDTLVLLCLNCSGEVVVEPHTGEPIHVDSDDRPLTYSCDPGDKKSYRVATI